MDLDWFDGVFKHRELSQPFSIDKDNEYYANLKKKFHFICDKAIENSINENYLDTICRTQDKILSSLVCFYNTDVEESYHIIYEMVSELMNDSMAVSNLNECPAFPGSNEEIQFFRARIGNPANEYAAKDMLYIPENMRSKAGNYRFSIPGNPSLYLSNTSYGCWIEIGYPIDNEFNVSPIILDGKQKIFNLAVSINDIDPNKEISESRICTWIKLFMLSMATSYRVMEKERTFKSEYIISQAIMMACKKLKLDGIAYYSKRVSNYVFSLCAVNLVLFVDYKDTDHNILNHLKLDDSFNYGMYKKLQELQTANNYQLRIIDPDHIINIGNYEKQYVYRETEFYEFDRFLFDLWTNKKIKCKKDEIPWGHIKLPT